MEKENNLIYTEWFNTLSICPVCYREILATIVVEKDRICMVKKCPAHGLFRGLVEPDKDFYLVARCGTKCRQCNEKNIGFLDVTSKCNINCKYCYHPKNNAAPDPSIDELVARAYEYKSAGFSNIANCYLLIGAEPTTRDDLPELAQALKQHHHGWQVGIVTNGVRIADKQYLKTLLNGGITNYGISLHPKKDNPSDAVYEKKLTAIENTKSLNVPMLEIKFTVGCVDDIGDVLETIEELKEMAYGFRIRAASMCWDEKKKTKKIFTSDIYNAVKDYARENGKPFGIDKCKDNNIYHFNVLYNSIPIRLISWPDITNIDLESMRCSVRSKALNGRYANAIYTFFINNGMEKGYLDGVRIKVDDTTL